MKYNIYLKNIILYEEVSNLLLYINELQHLFSFYNIKHKHQLEIFSCISILLLLVDKVLYLKVLVCLAYRKSIYMQA